AVAQGPLNEVLSRTNLPVDLGEDTVVVIEATVSERDDRWHMIKARFDGGELWIADDGHDVGDRVRLRIAARDVSLALNRAFHTSILNRLAARVAEIEQEDSAMAVVRLELGNTALLARISGRSAFELELKPGKEVWAQVKSVAVIH
ncbi:MAG: TOBE domain-containing protein, partial [Gammaproteobacteria bacterium]